MSKLRRNMAKPHTPLPRYLVDPRRVTTGRNGDVGRR